MKNKFYILLAGMIILLYSYQDHKSVNLSKIETKDKIVFFEGKKLNGVVYENYDDENLKMQWTFKDGVVDGLNEYYYKNGQLNQKIIWKKGIKEGPYELYYKNGQLKILGYYHENRKDGTFEYYLENGDLKESVIFEYGIRMQ